MARFLVVDGIIGGLACSTRIRFRRWRFCSCSCSVLWRTADTWRELRLSWTVFSADSDLSGKSFIPLLDLFRLRRSWRSWPSKTIENDNDRRTDDHDIDLRSLRRKASGYRSGGRCDRFRGDRISGRISDIYHVCDRCCGSAGFRNHSEKDKTVSRRCGTVCNGASGGSPSTGEDSTDPYMGKTQRIYQKSRNDPAACLYRNVVPWRIWIYRWKLWGCRGFCRQYSGIHRKCDRSDLYTAWIWKMAAGGSFSFRILSKRSNRNDNGRFWQM